MDKKSEQIKAMTLLSHLQRHSTSFVLFFSSESVWISTYSQIGMCAEEKKDLPNT